MRDYAVVSPTFWTGATGRAIRRLGPETQLVALYLITSPHANMLGLYYLPMPMLAHETGIPLEGASKALLSLFEAGFADYDDETEHVWVYEMARWQVLQRGEALHPDDKRVKGLTREFHRLPNNKFLHEFHVRYEGLFCLKAHPQTKPIGTPFEGALKPLRSQDQDHDQDQDQDQESGAEAGSKGHASSCAALSLDGPLDDVSPPGQVLVEIFRDLRLQIRPQLGHYVGSTKDDEAAVRLMRALTQGVGWRDGRALYRKAVETYLRESKSSTPTFAKFEADFDHWRERSANGHAPVVAPAHFGDPDEERRQNEAVLARVNASDEETAHESN